MNVRRGANMIGIVGLTALLCGAVAAVGIAFSLGKRSAKLQPLPRSSYRKIPCPDEKATHKPRVGVSVSNNVPQQDDAIKSEFSASECWLLEVYAADCQQGEGTHFVTLRWHEESQTPQSIVRYFDIYEGQSYLRWSRSGNPNCEHQDYESQSEFALALNVNHQARIEQVDLREGQPGKLVNWSIADFHPT